MVALNGTVTDLAYDWITEMIIAIESTHGRLLAVDVKTNQIILLKHKEYIHGLVIHPMRGYVTKIYW